MNKFLVHIINTTNQAKENGLKKPPEFVEYEDFSVFKKYLQGKYLKAECYTLKLVPLLPLQSITDYFTSY